MDNKNPVKIVHLILMVLMMAGTIGAAVRFIIELPNSPSSVANIILMALVFIMLVTGAIHLLKQYSKQAALYYKLFLILNVAVCLLTIFIDNFYYASHALMICISFLNGAKILLLIYLAIGRDLGSKNTWMLFWLLIATDIIKLILAVFYLNKVGFDISLTGYITALISDGTIGLSIRGKYLDKISRNREI
ncbi:MAG: hypothetical protein IKE53_05745 [Clostridiales bacterium]|nr:hypothetical protein [Clostridiales bacterium]